MMTNAKIFNGTTINEVISELDNIIEWSIKNNSRLGYFPALYKRVTEQVGISVLDKQFEDNERMEKLDVMFAKRYIDAFYQYQAGEKCTDSWLIAFEHTNDEDLTVIQHLSLGMNAHINLDLGIVGGMVSPNEDIQLLKNDFYQINDLLFALIDEVQDQLSEVWKPLKFLDTALGRFDEHFAEFSMNQFRSHAWEVAQKVATLDSKEGINQYVTELDEKVAKFSEHISDPFLPIQLITKTIQLGEKGEPRDIIKVLNRE